jgi:hypothetical protein
LPAAVAAVPEEMVEAEFLITAVEVVVAPSSMVAMAGPFLPTKGALAGSSAVAQVPLTMTAVVALAPVAAVVVAEGPVAASWILPMEAMEAMPPTVAVEVAVASASNSRTRTAAAVVVMAVSVVAAAPQGLAGLSSMAVMEETADLVAARASALAPALICMANRETLDVSAEVATAVAVGAEVELWEEPSSMTEAR